MCGLTAYVPVCSTLSAQACFTTLSSRCLVPHNKPSGDVRAMNRWRYRFPGMAAAPAPFATAIGTRLCSAAARLMRSVPQSVPSRMLSNVHSFKPDWYHYHRPSHDRRFAELTQFCRGHLSDSALQNEEAASEARRQKRMSQDPSSPIQHEEVHCCFPSVSASFSPLLTRPSAYSTDHDLSLQHYTPSGSHGSDLVFMR